MSRRKVKQTFRSIICSGVAEMNEQELTMPWDRWSSLFHVHLSHKLIKRGVALGAVFQMLHDGLEIGTLQELFTELFEEAPEVGIPFEISTPRITHTGNITFVKFTPEGMTVKLFNVVGPL